MPCVNSGLPQEFDHCCSNSWACDSGLTGNAVKYFQARCFVAEALGDMLLSAIRALRQRTAEQVSAGSLQPLAEIVHEGQVVALQVAHAAAHA